MVAPPSPDASQASSSSSSLTPPLPILDGTCTTLMKNYDRAVLSNLLHHEGKESSTIAQNHDPLDSERFVNDEEFGNDAGQLQVDTTQAN